MSGKVAKNEQRKEIASEQPEQSGQVDIPFEMAEVLEGVPEPQRKELTRMMVSSFSMVGRVSPEVEVAKKITSDHITTMLDTQNKGMEYTYKENTHKMIFLCVILVVVVIAILLIILLLRDKQPDLMNQILSTFIGAALGLGGGYGIGVSRRRDD